MAVAALSVCLTLPFLDQAFHVDDANFLALAAHATPDPLLLYDFFINWGGTQERAFDVLANPPLVPWYLALVSRVSSGQAWIYHVAFLPFLALTLVAAWRLGARFAPAAWPGWTAAAVGVSPAVVLASHTVMPDLPLLAFYTWGLYLGVMAIDGRRYGLGVAAGLTGGLSALCRYSGVTIVPLLALYTFLNRKRSAGVGLATVLASALPILLWSLTSFVVYGQVHLLAMTGFEVQAMGRADLMHKFSYELISIGLCVVAPLSWVGAVVGGRRVRAAALAGAGVGLAGGLMARMVWPSVFWLVVGGSGCGVALWVVGRALIVGLRRRVWWGRSSEDSDAIFLALWVVGILWFNAYLRFASVRYLLLLVLPSILLLVRWLRAWKAPEGLVAGAVIVVAAISFALSEVDHAFAGGYRAYAASLPSIAGSRWFVGHWGLQYYLERAGARALGPERWKAVQVGDEIVVPTHAWPQEMPRDLELRLVDTWKVSHAPGFRTFSVTGQACFYSNWLAPGPTRAWLPFTLAIGPLEEVARFEVVARRGKRAARDEAADFGPAPAFRGK